MAYRIRYGPPQKGERGGRILDKKIVPFILVALLIVAAALGVSNPTVKEYLIPGNPEVTEAALIDFIDDIKQGAAFGDAMTAFCREIIDNAAIPS